MSWSEAPADNGCLTCSPRCFCSILQLKSFYPSFQCDQNWSTIPLWWIRRLTVQKVEHSKYIGTCAYIIIVHMHFITTIYIYIKSYSLCLPVLRVHVMALRRWDSQLHTWNHSNGLCLEVLKAQRMFKDVRPRGKRTKTENMVQTCRIF